MSLSIGKAGNESFLAKVLKQLVVPVPVEEPDKEFGVISWRCREAKLLRKLPVSGPPVSVDDKIYQAVLISEFSKVIFSVSGDGGHCSDAGLDIYGQGSGVLVVIRKIRAVVSATTEIDTLLTIKFSTSGGPVE